jgi:hypothetical protein
MPVDELNEYADDGNMIMAVPGSMDVLPILKVKI